MHTDAREPETLPVDGSKAVAAAAGDAGLLSLTNSIARGFNSERVARAQLPEQLRGLRGGQRVTYSVDGERRVGFVACLIRRGEGKKARPGVRFTDGLVVMAADMTDVVVAEASLPECARFAGDGQRCRKCRVRRALHA